MYCQFCGKQIPDQAKFCPECGADLGGHARLALADLFTDISFQV